MGSPRSGFLSREEHAVCVTFVWVLLHRPCERGTKAAYANLKLTLPAMLCVVKSFVSDSRVSCLLPTAVEHAG